MELGSIENLMEPDFDDSARIVNGGVEVLDAIMAEIALVVADEFDKRRNWKDGDHGLGQERKCSTSPSTVSALGRRTQEDASASVLRIGPRESPCNARSPSGDNRARASEQDESKHAPSHKIEDVPGTAKNKSVPASSSIKGSSSSIATRKKTSKSPEQKNLLGPRVTGASKFKRQKPYNDLDNAPSVGDNTLVEFQSHNLFTLLDECP
ncbi:hypothetical protein Cni_G02002 [Canna indica]|uniref:Uncharacterized protein n=1 Tax=Canna indica TaxID=4628 RepID=A0AAQ3JRQ9_9LILI|nr:hypothetical protein Cni_G02002 [Canna indica]